MAAETQNCTWGPGQEGALLGCYFLFSLTPDCLEVVSSSWKIAPSFSLHPSLWGVLTNYMQAFLQSNSFPFVWSTSRKLDRLSCQPWQPFAQAAGPEEVSSASGAEMAYPGKSRLRRSFSEHIRVSTNKAWDVFWKSAREKRLSGQFSVFFLSLRSCLFPELNWYSFTSEITYASPMNGCLNAKKPRQSPLRALSVLSRHTVSYLGYWVTLWCYWTGMQDVDP